jgi:hypothetical protein
LSRSSKIKSRLIERISDESGTFVGAFRLVEGLPTHPHTGEIFWMKIWRTKLLAVKANN